MRYSYISNNCVAITISNTYDREYDHPFIGSLFVNDTEYVKFCKNFDHYLSVIPIFDHPKEDSTWAKQNGSPWYQHKHIKTPYPVMYLEDIEIHWIHEDSSDSLMQKYNRRLKRYGECKLIPYFLFSSWEMMNNHSVKEHRQLVKDFCTTNSLFLTRYPEDLGISHRVVLQEQWVGSSDNRNISHLYEFSDLANVEKIYLRLIKQMHDSKLALYIIGDSSIWVYTKRRIQKLLLQLNNPDIYVCTYPDKIDVEYDGEIAINVFNKPEINTYKTSNEIIMLSNMDACIQSCSPRREYEEYMYMSTSHIPMGKTLRPLKSMGTWKEFSDLNELIPIISSSMIKHIKLEKLDINTRKTVFDYLTEGKLYDKCNFSIDGLTLTNNTMIFFITSVIYIDESNNRSVFSSTERLTQTVKQVKTIKEKVPDSVVILLELSNLKLDDISILTQYVDKICLFTHDERAQYYTHKDSNKNKTEVYVIQQMLPYFRNLTYSHFLKFSGRYCLTENFNIEDFRPNKPSCKVVLNNFYKVPMVEPILYSIPKSHQDIYDSCLSRIHQILESYFLDVERLLYSTTQEKNINLNQLNNLNICGYGATDGTFRNL